MSFSAHSPPDSTGPDFSSRRNSMSNSSQPDLELDPSDPLNLLLNSQNPDSSMEDASVGGSPPDWSQLSALWSTPFETGEGNIKDFTDVMEFSIPLGSNLDFGSEMAIDPNALHFDTQKLGLDVFPSQNFSFAYQPDNANGRRLSVTSASSSSGVSLSPVVDSAALSHATAFDSAAEELAQRVRQSAGIMLAVPMQQNNNIAPSNFVMFAGQNPAPTYFQPASPESVRSLGSSTSSAESTPPPTTPPPSASVNPNFSTNTSVNNMNNYANNIAGMGIIPRPKSNHTTIERRYRTNLNARIMSLRMAVPALRVLEDKEGCGVGGGGKKGKGKNATLGKNVAFGSKVKKEGEEGEDVVDVIDERGFVDGVKVARKCSKANVLGKAVEYIRVLKKRELRLKREQEGLKTLVKGLVGGPALLQEWEREWREKFGGEEKDEVEGEEMDDVGSDDEGAGSGDDDDVDDEAARKRKRAKITPTKKETKEKRPPPPPQPVVLPDGSVVVPEKRKRGRPRKVVPPVTAAVTIDPTEHVPMHQLPVSQTAAGQSQPVQYLLATFALFSFFNSPFSSPSPTHPPPHHSHTGTVLTHDSLLSAPGYPTEWSWHDAAQAFHLLVSVLVFSSILAPWFPSLFRSFSVSFRKASSRFSSSTLSKSTISRSSSPSLVAALSSSNRGTETEVAGLRQALDEHHGFVATIKDIIGNSKKNVGFEQAGLEQRAWVRLGELSVLGDKTSLLNRFLTCYHMRSYLPWFTASAADLSTLALALWPLGRIAHRHARSIWDDARARKGFSGVREGGVGVQVRPHERLVLESITLDEAVKRLKSPDVVLKRKVTETEWKKYSPIGVLACMLVRERVKRHLEVMFVRTVLPNEECCEFEPEGGAGVQDKEEEELRKTMEAARSLGGKMAELGDTLRRMCTMGVWEFDDVSSIYHSDGDSDSDDDTDERELDLDTQIRVLLNALMLYRQIFSSSILGGSTLNGNGASSGVSILLSPPPSPVRQDGKMHYALRRLLGSSVFDSENDSGSSSSVEDARDRLVDMLVECERAGTRRPL